MHLCVCMCVCTHMQNKARKQKGSRLASVSEGTHRGEEERGKKGSVESGNVCLVPIKARPNYFTMLRFSLLQPLSLQP